jgi:hypothetical protein
MTALARLSAAALCAAITTPLALADPVRGLCGEAAGVCSGAAPSDSFPLITGGIPAVVRTDPGDHGGVRRAAQDLRADLERVSGEPSSPNHSDGNGLAIIVGTLGGNADIDAMAAGGRLDVSGIEGAWEGYVQQVVENPVPGVDRALVIAGSDMRGAIFGIYDLSERMGVSPWHWWADVPVPQASDLHVQAGLRAEAPTVRYRGIFINDENPALYGWVNETYGGFGQEFYTEVFELILRMRGNFLWPAMWGKAFYDDDALNPDMAQAYGIVIGTSHHEPMGRAHIEWERHGEGAWNYDTNPETLRRFWAEGVARLGGAEDLVTIGMRGDGDEAMTEGTATELLERIVADQREIIAEVTGRPARETRQVWALYKEVQDYFDAGMDVPEDVMLLFADDNWGNIRRLPRPGSDRPGGYGVYYHYDYVGGPRNYKWINVTQIERVWEQMNLAHEFGANELWIVNVGDIKPMEFPISFFLEHAWDPEAMTLEAMSGYTRLWAAQQFGETHADEIAALLTGYTKYNSRRTPEMVGPDTYSLIHFDEADRIDAEWAALAEEAHRLREVLDDDYDDAFVQLVWYPVVGAGNVTRLHNETARNRLYAAQGRVSANAHADAVREAFDLNAELNRVYHEDVADGKWPHMMSQTRISYTYWQQPDEDVIPDLETVEPVSGAALGFAVEGDERGWPGADGAPVISLHRWGADSRWIALFDRGGAPASFEIEPGADWVTLSQTAGQAGAETRVAVAADWSRAPEGRTEAELTVRGPDGTETVVTVEAVNPSAAPEPGRFVEGDGHIAIEAENHARAVGDDEIEWRTVPELGRTGSAVTAFPVLTEPREPGGDAPRLEYDIHLHEAGEVEIEVLISPTLDFKGPEGLEFAVSIGDGEPQRININADDSLETWNLQAGDRIARHVTTHTVSEPGPHTVNVWLIDTGVVFQRVVVWTGEQPDSYLGPLESRRAE